MGIKVEKRNQMICPFKNVYCAEDKCPLYILKKEQRNSRYEFDQLCGLSVLALAALREINHYAHCTTGRDDQFNVGEAYVDWNDC